MSKIRKQITSNIKDSYMGYGDFRDYIAVDLLENSFKDFSVSFTLFCAENFTHNSDSNYWWDSFGKRYTTEELYNIFIENYERNTTQ